MLGSKIKDLVIVKLEEKSSFLSPDSWSGPILSGKDDISELKPVYSYIDSHLSEAANEVLMVSPLSQLHPCELPQATVIPNEHTGKISLPDNYLRLHTLKMTDWSVPVHHTISIGHPNYKNQFRKYTCGHPEKPVAVYSGERATKTISYFSVYNQHTIEELLYIPTFSGDQKYTDKVAEAIALNVSKKVMEVYGNAEGITIMQNELNTVLDNMQL